MKEPIDESDAKNLPWGGPLRQKLKDADTQLFELICGVEELGKVDAEGYPTDFFQ